MFHNVVIGKPIVDIEILLATDKKDWEENEKEKTIRNNVKHLLRFGKRIVSGTRFAMN